MRQYRFYREKHGNVLALLLNGDGTPAGFECSPVLDAVASIYEHPNSAVSVCCVSPEYLRKNCRRISELKARDIHPRLFEYLDAAPAWVESPT